MIYINDIGHSMSFKAKSDLLISAPSIRVWRSVSKVSAPRSLPARSMKLILPCSSLFSRSFRLICRMACDLDLTHMCE